MKVINYAYTQVRRADTSPQQYLGTPAVVGGLLQAIEECLQDLRQSRAQQSSALKEVQGDNVEIEQRSRLLARLIHEAQKRFTLVNSTPMTAKIMPSSSTFMARMTAAPATLLTYCLRAGDYSQCEEISQFFSLQDQPQAQEACLAKQLELLTSTDDATSPNTPVIATFGIL